MINHPDFTRLVNLKQIFSLIIVFIGFGSDSAAQIAPLGTNQQVILDVIGNLVEHYVSDEGTSIPLAVHLPEATEQSLESVRNKLFQSGLKVTRDYTNSYQLRVVIDTSNELRRKDRSTYSRNLKGTITISVYDTVNVLVWSESTGFHYTDEVDKTFIQTLTTDWPISSFTTVEHRRSDRKILRWIQPVIITSAVATTVILLFSVRSY